MIQYTDRCNVLSFPFPSQNSVCSFLNELQLTHRVVVQSERGAKILSLLFITQTVMITPTINLTHELATPNQMLFCCFFFEVANMNKHSPTFAPDTTHFHIKCNLLTYFPPRFTLSFKTTLIWCLCKLWIIPWNWNKAAVFEQSLACTACSL